MSTNDEQRMALANALRALWSQAHGVATGPVKVYITADSIVAYIEDVFSPAEREFVRRGNGRMLHEYTEQLLSVIQAELRARVESITQRRIVTTSHHADVDSGTLVCFFVLGEPFALLPAPERDAEEV